MRKNFALVMFDLPMSSKIERKKYSSFVKALKANGYVMLQKSIYVKYIRSAEASTAEEVRVRSYAPSGSIFYLAVGYKTFCNMTAISGCDFDIDFLCNPIITL